MSAIATRLKTLLDLLSDVVRLLLVRCFSRHSKIVFFSLSGAQVGSAGDLRGRAVALALRQTGWDTIVIPPSVGRRLRRLLTRILAPQAILLQQTRHKLNSPTLYPEIPCILDVDDADILDAQHTNRIAQIATQCQGVIVGSRYLARIFAQYNHNVGVVWTGTYIKSVPDAEPVKLRRRIIAWAPSDPFGYPVEMVFVMAITRKIFSRSKNFGIRIYGVPVNRHAEFMDAWREQIPDDVSIDLRPPMPYREYISSLTDVAVGLQPVCEEHAYSLGKSFGKVLAYMAADVAVVASDNIDHPLFFTDRSNGRILINDVDRWASACVELMEDADFRESICKNARKHFEARLSVEKSSELVSFYLGKWASGQYGK